MRVVDITRYRQRRRASTGGVDFTPRSPAQKIALSASMLISLLVALGAISLALAYASLTSDLPPLESLPTLLDPPNGLLLQPTQLFDRSGEHLLLTLQTGEALDPVNPEVNASTQVVLPRLTIPASSLITATLASADPGFWNHPGFIWSDLRADSHPTLAQQLVYELLLAGEEPGLRRAFRERLLAAQATAQFGRARVLEWYLNNTRYGPLVYGAEAAARLYFGKSASELDLAEAALLAAVAKAPALNPLDAPLAALEGQKRVIQQMLYYRMLTPEQGVQAARQEISLHSAPDDPLKSRFQPDLAPVFTRLALAQLESAIPRSRIERGGLRIITTLDYDLQTQLACASAVQLARLQGVSLPEQYSPFSGQGGTAADCAAALLLPTLPTEAGTVNPVGEVNPMITQPDLSAAPGQLAPDALSFARAEALLLDPQTGQVLALTGPTPTSLDAGALPSHPPGSIITPIVYLTAFTRGLSPGSLVWDTPLEETASEVALPVDIISPVDSTDPVDFTGGYRGPMRLRFALANDYLIPAARILAQVGVENAWRTAQQMGLDAPAKSSTAGIVNPGGLFSFRDVNLIEISQVFGVFANQGTLAGHAVGTDNPAGKVNPSEREVNAQLNHLQAPAILRVEDVSGKLIVDWSTAQRRPIITPQLAYLMTNILSDETARWPSLGRSNPLEISRPAAAKIGRAAQAGFKRGDGFWTVGYTPQIVAGVWIGSPAGTVNPAGEADPAVQSTEAGEVNPPEIVWREVNAQNAAAGLWHAIIQYASNRFPYQEWNVPQGLSIIEVCDPSGMLPTKDCPSIVSEVFLAGSEPVQADRMYRLLPVNRETHRLATVYTPPDLVDERIFFIVPPQASQWAQQTGIPTPPDEYDTIPLALPVLPDVAITSPTLFSVVRGQTPILGTAGGDNPDGGASPEVNQFESYRIQIGQGLAPQEWLLIGQDVDQPVSQGQLALWDTSGLNGLYAIQLLVVHKDQAGLGRSVRRATILATVDNQAPELSVEYPADGEIIPYQPGSKIVLKASATDNLGIQQISFYINDQLLGEISQPPFALSWTLQKGIHKLRVEATNLAGNSSQTTISFTVQ